jgi:hypothetical protein
MASSRARASSGSGSAVLPSPRSTANTSPPWPRS